MTTIKCLICKQEKQAADFGRHKYLKQPACNACRVQCKGVTPSRKYINNLSSKDIKHAAYNLTRGD